MPWYRACLQACCAHMSNGSLFSICLRPDRAALIYAWKKTWIWKGPALIVLVICEEWVFIETPQQREIESINETSEHLSRPGHLSSRTNGDDPGHPRHEESAAGRGRREGLNVRGARVGCSGGGCGYKTDHAWSYLLVGSEGWRSVIANSQSCVLQLFCLRKWNAWKIKC